MWVKDALSRNETIITLDILALYYFNSIIFSGKSFIASF
jgi:hypothetical protein